MIEPKLHIKDLTSSDLEVLTQLLSISPRFPISSSWLHDQSSLISTFPPVLLKPHSFIQRLTTAFPFTLPKAHLCPSHKALNAILIRQIFLEVSIECTTQLDFPFAPPNLAAFIKRLQTANGLWTSPDLCRMMFFLIPASQRYERVASGCEACILARVGGNHSVLSDLRASILGRKRRGKPHATLLRLVEAWIDWTGRGDEIRAESGKLGKEINSFRRLMQKERRWARDGGGELGRESGSEGETIADEPLGCCARNGQESHSLIADYYTMRLSTATLLSANAVEDIHPALRDTIVFDLTFRTFQPLNAEAQGSRYPKACPESTYNNAESSRKVSADLRQSSERHARAYQDLLGLPG